MKPVTRTLLLMAAAVLLPMAAAVAWYFLGAPGGRMNYGELLARPLPPATLASLDGQPVDFASLKGKWLLLQVDAAACDAACRAKLYHMRQSRAAQGKHQERIERVWLVSDGATPAPELMREYQGTLVLRAAGSPLLAALPARGTVRDHIYLIDPLGNLVLRYPGTPDTKRMAQDLDRLLRASRIG
ncbi:MAG: SCO family protein [Pseudomonadota bacterium]